MKTGTYNMTTGKATLDGATKGSEAMKYEQTARLYEHTARYFEKTYNPECDLPLGPQITYPEMELFLLVESLVKVVQEQQERIERLEQQQREKG